MSSTIDVRKIKTPKFSPRNSQNYRRALGESQGRFWQRFGVTQSGGSRYESGRTIPRPVRMLMKLYTAGVVTEEDLRVAAGGRPKREKAVK